MRFVQRKLTVSSDVEGFGLNAHVSAGKWWKLTAEQLGANFGALLLFLGAGWKCGSRVTADWWRYRKPWSAWKWPMIMPRPLPVTQTNNEHWVTDTAGLTGEVWIYCQVQEERYFPRVPQLSLVETKSPVLFTNNRSMHIWRKLTVTILSRCCTLRWHQSLSHPCRLLKNSCRSLSDTCQLPSNTDWWLRAFGTCH